MDYKKYSLENLEKWIEDAINSSEASPQEIYDVIKNVVSDNYYCYKNHTERCYELLALLNGNGKQNLTCDKDDSSEECKGAWNDFWEEHYYPEEYKGSTVSSVSHKKSLNDVDPQEYINEQQYSLIKDNVVKWQLPVELDGLTGECYVMFPDDLLEAANLKEGDTVEWIDRKDGSFELRKINGTK